MTGPNWKLEDDLETVTLTLPTNPPATLRLKLADIEDMLAHLGDFRELMKPPVPATYAMGQVFDAVPNPAWVSEPELMQGNSALHIRDPRYGWLHYMLPREEAQRLASFLQKQVDAPHPAAETGKLN